MAHHTYNQTCWSSAWVCIEEALWLAATELVAGLAALIFQSGDEV